MFSVETRKTNSSPISTLKFNCDDSESVVNNYSINLFSDMLCQSKSHTLHLLSPFGVNHFDTFIVNNNKVNECVDYLNSIVAANKLTGGRVIWEKDWVD